MKKFFRVISLFIVCILGLTSCATKPDYDTYDALFIQHFSNEDDYKEKVIDNLVCYFMENEETPQLSEYYYVVTFHDEDVYGDRELEVLYSFRCQSLNDWYNIQDEDTCYKYFPDSYSKFLEAKVNGMKREYTQDEINQLFINEYGNNE